VRIRGESQEVQRPSNRRRNAIERIYGADNADVRAEVHKIENESINYWKTGIRSNSTFEVNYRNHPYDPINRNRNLKEQEILFAPMRIQTDIEALEAQRNSRNGDQIDFITDKILPRMVDFWSNALAVVPIEGELFIQQGELVNGYCGDSEFAAVPAEHISKGIENTDLMLYISGTPSSRFCGPSTLAVAVACNWDQFDRPTAGAINFCINTIDLNADGSAHESVIDDNVDVAVHEAGHVLGMSSNSYRFFWDPATNKPRTNRPIRQEEAECVNGEVRDVFLPAENTLQFITRENGRRSAVIVTEKVRTVAQNQFNCADLEGAQLENQPTGTSCTGDHWDERLYYPESLSGVISPSTNVLSPLTLALMEDSGWYSANYSFAELSPWGHGVGCDFVREPCLVQENGVTVVPDYGKGFFCTKASQRGCSPTHHYKMACFYRDYSLSSNPADAPPPEFQYFANPTVGGLKTADYCPVFGSDYKANVYDLDCRNSENSDIFDWKGLTEVYGKDSKCYETTTGEALCYESACIYDTRQLNVRLGDGAWYVCESDFQEIAVQSTVSNILGQKIICPRLSQACPDLFCPVNCAGRGICNYDAVDDEGRVRPKCECFDQEDTSLGCTDSLILDGFLQDSTGLFDGKARDFMTPLVAVFTDEPSSWNTASWIWASTIFVVFLLLVLCICSTFWPKKRGRRGGSRPPPNRASYMRPPRRNRRRSRDRDESPFGRGGSPRRSPRRSGRRSSHSFD